MGGSIRTNAAAAMLGVSPNTLRSWERRFGYPEPKRTAGGHRQFDLAEIEALRAAFEETQNISSAVSVARERGTGPASPARLESAFGRFDEDGADRLIEESLTVRSVERTIEEVLLPTVESLAPAPGAPPTPEYGFAWRYATGWLAATQRVAPPASRPEGVLVFDASRAPEAEALQAQALELILRRGGLRTLTLTADSDPNRLSHAITALDPRAVVLTGRGASLDALGRLVFTARRVAGEDVAILDYRGAIPHAGSSTVEVLPDGPLAARDAILARIDGRAGTGRFVRGESRAIGL
ncbi:MAG TPA: MerR family transcriptional regulator [Baekduia sp.]|uniref:MerR family transcriptional regulator n=1 Tax=Baekduia sp. TaxID=2600305 RepID=UPI002BAFDF25|nr:MerR family transcriptional regulator [Baekduia sp.]HMJ34176.1 MerR family transcriptional regulator [Baekduia sp.]